MDRRTIRANTPTDASALAKYLRRMDTRRGEARKRAESVFAHIDRAIKEGRFYERE